MKRLSITLVLILISLMSFSQNKDSNGHVLVGLWKTYYKAADADKPQDQLKALEAIKAEAIAKHLAWDFYDAASTCIDVRSSMNWKDRSAAVTDFEKELNEFGEPVAVYYYYRNGWSKERLSKYLKDHEETMLKSCNSQFYRMDGSVASGAVYSPVLLKRLDNDYEYALWSMFLSGRGGDIDAWYQGNYPFDAFIEYTRISRYVNKDSYEKLGAYAVRYSGKAVSLLAKEKRLSYEFDSYRKDKKTSSDTYKAFRKRCEDFETERQGFTGAEKQIADCCTDVGDIIKSLDAKEIDSEIRDDVLTLRLRNVSSLRVRILAGEHAEKTEKAVYDNTVTNRSGSYYIVDTVKVKLPVLDDGDYTLLCGSGNCEDRKTYSRHSLSVAVRPDSGGYGIFVADYITGKPVDVCDLALLDADRNSLAVARGVKFDGFTRIPESMGTYFGKARSSYFLQASFDEGGHKRLSKPVNVSSYSPGSTTMLTNARTKRAVLITDRGAYNPDETLYFKAVLYQGTYEYELLGAGVPVTAELLNPQDEVMRSITLKTNDFASVEGSFPLSGSARGGLFTVNIKSGDSVIASKNVRVDEFVLPTYDISWNEDNNLYLPGDEIKVSGKLAAYSGHSLGNAKAVYSVRGYVDNEAMGDLQLAPDGSFEFSFNVPEKNWAWAYRIELTVTDATGETLRFNTVRHVYREAPLNLSLENKVRGSYTLKSSTRYYDGSDWIVRDSHADILFELGNLNRKGLEISYEVFYGDKQVRSGKAGAGEVVPIDLNGLKSGLYRIEATAVATKVDGTTVTGKRSATFVKAGDDDTALDMGVTSFFKELGDDEIALQIGSTDGPVWAVVELFGSGNVLLEHQIVTLSGVRGKAGSLKTVRYERRPEWPETLSLCVLFFHKGECYRYTRRLELPIIEKPLPLSFTRFFDSTKPGQQYSFLIKTDPGVECAASIFDKATETIMGNQWSRVQPIRRPEPYVYYSTVCGQNATVWDVYYMVEESAVNGGVRFKTAATRSPSMVGVLQDQATPEMEDALGSEETGAAEEIRVRENFGATMAWEPMLRSDADGNIEFKFTGSDRLSTYYVQLFAHGEGMKNAVLRREMKLTIPVKVALVEPKFLYAGDVYKARVTVSSNEVTPITGRVAIRFYDGEDYKTAQVVGTRSAKLSLPSCGSVPFDAEFTVPSGVPVLGVLVNFVADDPSLGSDAVFVKIPVRNACQTLTEAHSALLRAGMDKDALVAELRSLFVNLDASALEPVERSIIDMIREAIPDMVEPKNESVMSLTEAYYSNVIARSLGAPGLPDDRMREMMDKIAACQNQGGGIAWFEGMEASPMITAAVLQRIASMPGEDTGSIDIEKAVKYLDSSYFGKTDRPWWCGGISLPVYLQTRALYPTVPFTAPKGKQFREFRKSAKEYLVPTGKRGLNAQILAKARRLRTLQLLATSPGGTELAKSWGITLKKRILRSLDADVESLLQYAVEHVSGGCYYPNAVMPWRGLLESEVYAHSLLCDLLTDVSAPLRSGQHDNSVILSDSEGSRVAEGIRLWLMVQKETQHWSDDAAYLEGLASVLRGTEETLQTKVVLLSGRFTKPFAEVKAAGNGFTVARSFTVDGRELTDGDVLKVGDRVVATYRIWNEENRSFVRLTAPRPASFRPVNQLSGRYGWWLAPLRFNSWTFTPQGYRNVLSDKTEYWFDSYPEENTVITEEFFVTQEGRFQTPAVEIESLYAPHYRANDTGRGAVESR